IPQPGLDLLHREMIRRGEDHLRDHLPLLRDRQALVAQITPKEMYEAHDSSSLDRIRLIIIIDNYTPRAMQAVPSSPMPLSSSAHLSLSPPIPTSCGGRVASSSSRRRITPATTL